MPLAILEVVTEFWKKLSPETKRIVLWFLLAVLVLFFGAYLRTN